MIEVHDAYKHGRYEEIWLNTLRVMSNIRVFATQDGQIRLITYIRFHMILIWIKKNAGKEEGEKERKQARKMGKLRNSNLYTYIHWREKNNGKTARIRQTEKGKKKKKKKRKPKAKHKMLHTSTRTVKRKERNKCRMKKETEKRRERKQRKKDG